ncbi:hypothetical protein [Acrocarpospora catenulata]|uniref:hypothetical protein n=1 Tax=Acrocarpospora catenulata TaxID=2836182 RepID=UPI001BD99017|nr:hypothetical protein [Acrocarpospora catenulata]
MYVGRSSLRVLRAAVFAAVCVLISAVLHVLAGGAPVRVGYLAAAMMLTWLGAYLLAGRQRGMDVLLAACFGAQYGMHHLFTVGAETSASSPWADEHGDGTGVGMVLIHVAMAILSTWMLERGESALALIVYLAVAPVRGLRGLLRSLVGALVDIVPPTFGGPVRDRPAPPLRRSGFVVVVTRRGPPPAVSVL